ncbi:hypothetical protein [Haloechinothrix salitolerans]|uniref:Uncharacterized protein n=1 Tax=Haloechinothrix salitolerans TaxID=926830 RepID=A0ABW2C8E5_9PSEU
MPGIGVFSWVLIIIAALSAGALAYYLRPSIGRHARKPARMNIDEPISADDVETTVVLGNLYGADLISGYETYDRYPEYVYEEEQSALVRPYLLHHLRTMDPERTTELAAFKWLDDEDYAAPGTPVLVAA